MLTRAGVGAVALVLFLFLCGCVSSRPAASAPARGFNFDTDTFAYANELLWTYHYEEGGRTWTETRVPKPDYTLHCFVVARAAAQFFENARFEPSYPPVDESAYRRLIRKVARSSLRRPPAEKVSIPGYANLREFSNAREKLLKEECGSAWQSYLQRGHWRMVFPFSRKHQDRTAAHLVEAVAKGRPAVVHVARFPKLSINHALVVFRCRESPTEVYFEVYDPNEPAAPSVLMYRRSSRTFCMPANKYFRGGRVNVYRVYHAWNY
jgi:hypothetical protein